MTDYLENTDDEHCDFVEKQEGEARCLGAVTCFCGNETGLIVAYRCLYCKGWFCEPCAEKHFGQTVDEYHQEAK